MLDWLYITLILCLLASNLNRILWIGQQFLAYFSRPREPRMIPYFDEHGQLVGMVRVPAQHRYRPIPSASSHSESQDQIPNKVETDSDSDTPHRPVKLATQIPSALSWDCWPDGKFQYFFSHQRLSDTNQLAMNWALETIHNRGTPNALRWQSGNELRRRCLGIIQCHGKRCTLLLTPALRAMDRQKQMRQTCPLCDETLLLHQCGIESSLFRFREGGVFVHGGDHNHQGYTHSSVFRRNGSVEFIEYLLKYSPRSFSPVPQDTDPSEDAKEQGNSDDGYSGHAEEPMDGIVSDLCLLDQRLKNSIDANAEEEWEIHQDPDAELDELSDD
ncbi:hypothetical protein B0H16DRAFT_1469671 [Mycena metata]|uniref:Uncharacterized protein n=1 Tax=Mycena metata TaxID=1033252 RepID=A0AAD7HXB4_9AGAR|nr:hypothetical protein B0H16DRAFT_1469671 [Mycena metata]